MKADLHFHSIYSDGQFDINHLVNVLKEKNVLFACLTDHDTIEGSSLFIQEASKFGIKSFPSLELTTKRNEESIHITAYFRSTDSISNEFKSYLKEMRQKRYDRLRKMTDNINNLYNFNIDFNKIAEKHPYNLERPHLADEIASITGLTRKEVFQKYIGNDCPAYIPASNLSIEEGIKMIHESNGIAMLAHPYQYTKNDSVELIDLYDFDGVEVYYYPTPVKKYKKYLKIVKKKNLLLSGGSDYHKEFDFKHSELGSGEIPSPYIDNFIETIEKLK